MIDTKKIPTAYAEVLVGINDPLAKSCRYYRSGHIDKAGKMLKYLGLEMAADVEKKKALYWKNEAVDLFMGLGLLLYACEKEESRIHMGSIWHIRSYMEIDETKKNGQVFWDLLNTFSEDSIVRQRLSFMYDLHLDPKRQEKKFWGIVRSFDAMMQRFPKDAYECLPHFVPSDYIRRKIYEEQGTQKIARDYSFSCCRIGSVYEKQGKLAEALVKYEEALSINRRLYEEQGTPQSARDYSISCGRVGVVYEKQGKLDEALAKCEESLSISRRLYEEQGMSQSEQDYKFSCNDVKRIQRKKDGVSANKIVSIFNDAVQKNCDKTGISIPQLYSLDWLKEKQIQNILKYCAKGIGKEEIVVFCGTKLLNNNGKRGVVFTTKGIYADDSIHKHTKGKKIDLPVLYADIVKCEYEEKHSGHVKCLLTDGRYLYLYMDIYSRFFCEVISQIADW